MFRLHQLLSAANPCMLNNVRNCQSIRASLLIDVCLTSFELPRYPVNVLKISPCQSRF